jgi:hypothetical protein
VKSTQRFVFPIVALPAAGEHEVTRYRQRAEECWARAMAADDPHVSLMWVDLAAHWNELVNSIDRRRVRVSHH